MQTDTVIQQDGSQCEHGLQEFQSDLRDPGESETYEGRLAEMVPTAECKDETNSEKRSLEITK